MADIERALVSKAIQTGQVEEIISRGIEPDHFKVDEAREVWETCVNLTRKYKAPPSVEKIKTKHKKFGFILGTDPLESLIDDFIVTVKRRKAIELARDFSDSIDDPDQVQDIEVVALEMARTLTQLVPTPKVARYSEMQKRIDEYNRRLELGEEHGIRIGVPTIDDLTLGIQPHEYVTIVAYLGMGKSTFMQYILYQAYLQGKTPMIISLEMEAEAILRKFDAMATQIRYQAIKALDLGEGDLKRWEKIAERADKDKHEKDIIVIDNVANCTVDKVFAETVRYQPDVVGVDYISLMEAPKGVSSAMWEKVTYCTRGLKQNARTLKIPVIGAAQFNREGGKGNIDLTNIGYSNSIAQDSDIVLALNQDEDMKYDKVMDVHLLKYRDGRTTNAELIWNLDIMDIRERTGREIINRVKRDDGKEEITSNDPAQKGNPFTKKPQEEVAA